jgi:hypothetical protein
MNTEDMLTRLAHEKQETRELRRHAEDTRDAVLEYSMCVRLERINAAVDGLNARSERHAH